MDKYPLRAPRAVRRCLDTFELNQELSNEGTARKVLLPVLQLSELTTNSDPRAIKRVIPQGKGHAAFTYYYRHVSIDDVGSRLNYNLFPVVLDRKSVPWSLGTLYLLAQLEGQTAPAMTTYQSKADDLGSYKEWLDTHPDSGKLVFRFPKITKARITYRYRGYLERLIQAREIAPTTAKRRMGTVIAFYRWLMNNNYFQPEYQPWEETKTLHSVWIKEQDSAALVPVERAK